MNIIAQYCTNCSPRHIEAAKYAIKYLKGTPNLGIKYSSRHNDSLESFVQFPLDPSKLQSLTDANWGPQDQSVTKDTDDPVLLELFKSRSTAGYVIWLGGPIDWVSKCQSYYKNNPNDFCIILEYNSRDKARRAPRCCIPK
jgi:hypothetical protein